MTRWEYQVVESTVRDQRKLKELLDAEGAAGWELVAVQAIQLGGHLAFMKRRKSNEDTTRSW